MNNSNGANDENGKGPFITSYTCPGELYSIPRSIHLARLASYYHKCQNCNHRFDSGSIQVHSTNENFATPINATRETLLTDENVRGVYLNEIDRNRAIAWGEALAAYLWDQKPMVAGRKPQDAAQIVAENVASNSASLPNNPQIVIGFDERPSSPDITTGAVLGLRRMGCSAIDLGQTTSAILAYNLQSLGADAGLFITGAGCNPSLTGFDFFSRRANPFFYEDLLSLERFAKTGVGRQSRQIGGHRPFHGQTGYEASLVSQFHALRPLRVACGCSTRLLSRILDRIFSGLPCELTHVPLPIRRRNLFDTSDLDLQRIGNAVVEGQHHLGLIIDEDGQHVAFVTDRGRLVTVREVARLLIEFMQRESHSATFVVATSWLSDVRRWLSGRDAQAIDGGETSASLVQCLTEHEAILALSADGRIWFDHTNPTCDALRVLAKVLQALSLSDAPFSEVIARISTDLESH